VNRRRFLTSALGAGALTLGSPWLASARAATEDDLAFANFGASTEFLVKDFYARALDAKLVTGPKANALKRGRAAAAQHAKALSDLLTGAGDVAPLPEDFEFAWPASTFETEKTMVETGRGVLRALLGAYQTAAATASDPVYRVLYASLAASVSQ
jgi:Ferritin-like domain